MSTISMNNKLNIVQFLDFLGTIILMSSVPPTLLKSGVTIFMLGSFMSLSSAVRMFAKKLSTELMEISRTRDLLKYYLIASLILNVALFMTTSPYGILINRLVYIFANHVTVFSGQMMDGDPKDRRIFEKSHVQMLTASLIAATIVGSTIDNKGGFYSLVMIATLISGIELAVVLQIQPQEDVKKKQLTASLAAKVVPKTLSNSIKTIRNIDIHFSNWKALLIKSLLVVNSKVVFILYVIMIIFVFRGNGATVSITSAYQTIAISLSGLAFNKLNSNIIHLGNPREILEKSSIVCMASALVMGFSPSYLLYLLTFIPFIISRTFVENYFLDVYEVKKNQKLGKDIESIAAISDIISPLFIGLSFHLYKQNGYRILAAAPFLLIYYISKNRTLNEKHEENLKKKKDNEAVETNKDK